MRDFGDNAEKADERFVHGIVLLQVLTGKRPGEVAKIAQDHNCLSALVMDAGHKATKAMFMTDNKTKTSQNQIAELDIEYAELWMWMRKHSEALANGPEKAMSIKHAMSRASKTLSNICRSISLGKKGITALVFRKYRISNAWIINYSDPRPTANGPNPREGEKHRWEDVNPGQHTNEKTCVDHYLSDFDWRQLECYANLRR